MAPRIRPLQADDLERVADLLHADMRSLGVDTSHDRLRSLVQRVLDDDATTCRCWIALDTGDDPHAEPPLAGMILVNFVHSIKFAGPSLWIEGLYVDPSHRRRGIGRALVEHICDWAEARPFCGIDLEAYQNNTPAAILYRSLGFKRLGRARFSLDLAPDE